MNVLTLALVAVYLLFIVYLGYRGYRGTKTVTDYLVAGRNTHPFVMALSYGSTFISTSAIVGFGGAAAVFGMSLHWLTFLNIAVGIFCCFVFLGARTREMGHRLNAHTFGELLGRRFDSKAVQVLTGLVILVFMPLYTAVVAMGAGRVVEQSMNMPYWLAMVVFSVIVLLYVTVGGIKGVMYTDALQGFIMLVGMTLLMGITYWKLGGAVSAHRQLTDMAPLAIELFGKNGSRGWTAMPEFGSPYWWTVMTIVLGVGVGVLAQPQLAVRYMTVKSARELNRATIVGGVFILVMIGVSYTVGPLSNIFFKNDPNFGKVALLAADKDVEKIIPLFIHTYMPPWLGSFIVVTLLAAAMSTLSGQFHAMGSAASRDLYETLTGARAGRGSIMAARIGIFVTFVVSLALALALPSYFKGTGTAIIARGTTIFFGLCCATFLPMYIGGLYSKRITKTGALAGALTGFLLSAFWLLFMHQKESEALLLCNALFGKPSLVAGVRTGFILWPEVDTILVAFPVSAAITVIVSLFTKPFDNTHLQTCFAGAKQA